MVASYPSTLPDYTGDVGGAGDPLDTPDHASHHQDVADDIEAIAAELGTNASTFAATVRDALEAHGSRHEVGGADPAKRVLLDRIAAGTTQTISTSCSLVGCTAEGITITLASSMIVAGAWVDIVDESGAAGTTAITVNTEGTETIDGSASRTISANYGQVRIYSDGTNWFTR